MIADKSITILTVSWNSSDYLKYLEQNLLHKADFPERISFLVVDNTNGADNELNSLALNKRNITIDLNNPQYKIASQNHASGLNAGISKVKTDYVLIIDPDVYLFKSSWDSFFIDELNNTEAIGLGAVYPNWQLGKYHNFPSPVFSFFKTSELLKLGADWMCYNENCFARLLNIALLLLVRGGYLINRQVYIKNKIVRDIFTWLESILPVCSCETGWQMARKAAKEGNGQLILFKALCDPVKFTLKNNKLNDALRKLVNNFEVYSYRGELILSHLYSSGAKLWQTAEAQNNQLWRDLSVSLDQA